MKTALGVATAVLLIILGAYYGSTVPVLSDWLAGHFGLAAGGVGVLFAASSLGGLVGALPAGVLLDTRGPRTTLIVATVALCLGYGVLAVTGAFRVFWAGAFVVHLASIGVGLSVPFYVLLLKPEWTRRSFALGMVSASAPGLFFPMIAERMLTATATERLVRLALGSVALLAAFAAVAFVLRLFGSDASSRQRSLAAAADPNAGVSGAVVRFLRQAAVAFGVPRFRLFLLLMFLHATADTFIHYWFPRFLRTSFDVLPVRPGLVLTLFSAAYVVSRLVLMALPDHFGRRALLVVPGIVGGSILLIGLRLGSPVLVALSYPLAALFWSVEAPSLLGEANRTFPGTMGAFQTIFQIATYAVGAILHVGVGALVDRGLPLRAVLSVFALFYVAFGLIALVGLRPPHGEGTTSRIS